MICKQQFLLSTFFFLKLWFFSIFKDIKCSSFDSFTSYKGLSCRAKSSLIPAPHLFCLGTSAPKQIDVNLPKVINTQYTWSLKACPPSLIGVWQNSLFCCPALLFALLHQSIWCFGIMLQYSESDDSILQKLLETVPVRSKNAQEQKRSLVLICSHIGW